MAKITLKGNEINTVGQLPEVGTMAPDFTLVTSELSTVSLSDYKGSRLVMNIFPSLETSTCAASVRYFNKAASEMQNTKVLCISRDLPFTQSKFCGAEGLDNVITLSDFRTGEFGKNYGLSMIDGPMQGLLSRVVIVLDDKGKVIYTQQVPEVSIEPDYDDVMKNL